MHGKGGATKDMVLELLPAVLISPDTLNLRQWQGRRAQDMVRGLLLPALIIAGLLAAAAAVSWQLLFTFARNLELVRALSPVLAALLALLLCYQVARSPMLQEPVVDNRA